MKKIIRLKESDLHKIIAKSVTSILKEEGGRTNQTFRDKYPVDPTSYDPSTVRDRDYIMEEILNRIHPLLTEIEKQVNNVLSEYGLDGDKFDESYLYDMLNDAVDSILEKGYYDYPF